MDLQHISVSRQLGRITPAHLAEKNPLGGVVCSWGLNPRGLTQVGLVVCPFWSGQGRAVCENRLHERDNPFATRYNPQTLHECTPALTLAPPPLAVSQSGLVPDRERLGRRNSVTVLWEVGFPHAKQVDSSVHLPFSHRN